MWQICIRYPNGQEKPICVCKNRELALKKIDAIYAQGYPMHVAYVVRAIDSNYSNKENLDLNSLQLA